MSARVRGREGRICGREQVLVGVLLFEKRGGGGGGRKRERRERLTKSE